MSLHFKTGLDLRGMTPQALLAIIVANECFDTVGEDCFVTCVRRPGDFAHDGFHSTGNGVDFGVKRLSGALIPDAAVDSVVRNLRTRIGREGGGQYDVVDERPGRSPSKQSTGPHLHVEFDPK